MSIEEYHRLPFSLVWKQEYINGYLVESPRHVFVHATVPVLKSLYEPGGYRTLVSRYAPGNEPSRAWHQRFGFKEEPDLSIAQLRLRAVRHELDRRRKMNTLTPELACQHGTERDRWHAEVERLERLERLLKAGHGEEAWPWRKWPREFKE